MNPINPIYPQLFEMLQMYIYGMDATLTPDMNLTLTFLATIASVFVVSLPFIVVYLVIRSVVK